MTKKEFEHFTSSIKLYLTSMKDLLVKEELDFSLDELSRVNKLFIENLPKKLKEKDYLKFKLTFVAYVGTAIRWWCGGEWLFFDQLENEFEPCIYNKNGGEILSSVIPVYGWVSSLENNKDYDRFNRLFKRYLNVIEINKMKVEEFKPLRLDPEQIYKE